MEIRRKPEIDIIKGIAIILMVLGHCNAPFSHWIYLFHMPVFFMASGYCWNVCHSKDLTSVIKYIYRKLKTLYFPYVLFNCTLVLLNNRLIDWGLYTADARFLQIAGIGAQHGLAHYMTTGEIIKEFARTMLFLGGTELGGATWFLRILFCITVWHCIVEWIFKLIGNDKFRNYGLLLVFIVFCVLSGLISDRKISLPIETLNLSISAYVAYLLGFFFACYDKIAPKTKIYSSLAGVLSFSILIVMNNFGGIGMASAYITNPIFFILTSTNGWIMLRVVASMLAPKIKNTLAFIGQHTLSIVLLHFCSFKIVSFLYIIHNNEERILLASYPVIDGSCSYLWIIYGLVGVAVPLIINILYIKILSRLNGQNSLDS